jgi:hypothetical protein
MSFKAGGMMMMTMRESSHSQGSARTFLLMVAGVATASRSRLKTSVE